MREEVVKGAIVLVTIILVVRYECGKRVPGLERGRDPRGKKNPCRKPGISVNAYRVNRWGSVEFRDTRSASLI